METPNTRSRRKRELENSSQEDGLKVAWVHDSQLRKAVLQATEDDPIAPPTPTQCPRPISNLLKSSSSSSGFGLNSNSSGSRPVRKRPCRGHRSLPTSSKGPALDTETSIGSISLPSMSILSNVEKEKTRLDYLLDRFSLLSSPMDEEKNKRTDYIGNQAETPSRNTRSKNQTGSSRGGMITSTPLKKKNINTSTTTTHEPILNAKLRGKSKDHLNENINSYPHSRYLTHEPQVLFNPPITTSSIVSDPIGSRKPLSPVKGYGPRLGLGSQHKPSITSNRTGGWTRTNSGKAFRTPFLENANDQNHSIGIRSSPRKITGQHSKSITTKPSISVRGPANHFNASMKTNESTIEITKTSGNISKRPGNLRSNTNTSNTNSSSANSSLPPTPPVQQVEFKNFDVGENEPEDTSFDSFDGIFASGGEEIERILRSVDGSIR
ncbi:uncharacterized protein I206_104174 [Kwoniella pini CBS 10737]|uniref:Uncharacterized protein n=1 Tax=Kwoniella pini CBS 10737 TaxID=1296096 RepID=A0A1B9I2G6_9TREE|nr:uncharacterized protein I206_04251 [Kwoniella pini CBS 10737]OCF49727.1 hypothetical protein I206_04251 [Kwoniella pini CBS 10737]